MRIPRPITMPGLNKSLALISLVSAFGIAISACSSAEELTLTREVFLEQGTFPTVNAMVRTSDNGFVIAGSIRKEGWATGTDGCVAREPFL